MNIYQDHIDAIEVLEDSELEFTYQYLTDTIFKIDFNIKKNKNNPIMSLMIDHGNLYSTYDVKYIRSKNPIIKRIKKLTGYELDSYTMALIPGDNSLSMILRFSK